MSENDTPPAKMAKKRKQIYNSRLKQLQACAEQQQFLLHRAYCAGQEEQERHMVLADAISQQKVLYKLLMPAHQKWLKLTTQKADAPWSFRATAAAAAAAAAGDGKGVDWTSLAPVVASCNPMLAAIIQATPQQVQDSLGVTASELVDIHTALFRELVTLLELVSPQRYSGEDVSLMQQQHQQQLPGEPQLNTLDAAALDPEAHAAAAARADAEARLFELVEQSYRLGGLLVLHKPTVMMEMCSTNLAARQQGVAPMRHMMKAAERLGLHDHQVLHLRLMLQHYNRTMQAQLQEGLQLLKLSNDSASLQTAALTAQSSAERQSRDTTPPCARTGRNNSSDASDPWTAAAEAAPGGGPAADGVSAHGPNSSGESRGSASTCRAGSSGHGSRKEGRQVPVAATGDAGEPAEDADVAEQLQRHLSARMQLLQLMGFFVANTLSRVQMAKFIVYSWPYYPLCSALAEAAALLPTCGTPEPEVQQHMAARRAGMGQELAWLTEHCPECHSPRSGAGNRK